MKRGWLVLLVAVVVFAPKQARTQAAVYGEFSSSLFDDPATNRTLYGGTVGLLDGFVTLHRVKIDANFQGRIVSGSHESLKSFAIGPRAEVRLFRGFSVYGEGLVGFGRYTSTSSNPNEAAPSGTTDAVLEWNGGLSKRLTPHLDAVLEYSYEQLYALGGIYNPKTASIGAVYSFAKR